MFIESYNSDRTVNIINSHTGEIRPFNHSIIISFEEYNSVYYKKISHNDNGELSVNIDYLLDVFFGGIDNFMKLYKEDLSEESLYQLEMFNVIPEIKAFVDTHEPTRQKRISFKIYPLLFNFTDKELDTAGNIENLLKQRKLRKNIKGF